MGNRRAGGQAVRNCVRGLLVVSFLTARPADRLSAQSPDPTAILDRAVAAYARVQTLRADFTQVASDPMLADTQTSRGEFLEQRPGKFAMRWTDPRGDVIVADGRTLWVFLPSAAPNQVVRSTLGGPGGEQADVIAEFLDRPRERFTVAYDRADPVGARPADVLVLNPRDRNAAYRRVLIWVDRGDALVRRLEISEASGTVRRITFDRLRTNVRIPASLLTFTPPRGARVVDASQ